jgi:hypothetical protein
MPDYVRVENMQIGDVLKWQHQPLAIVSHPAKQDRAMRAQCIYLRPTNGGSWSVEAGHIVNFNLSSMSRWNGPLTDEEEAMIMKAILLDA